MRSSLGRVTLLALLAVVLFPGTTQGAPMTWDVAQDFSLPARWCRVTSR